MIYKLMLITAIVYYIIIILRMERKRYGSNKDNKSNNINN